MMRVLSKLGRLQRQWREALAALQHWPWLRTLQTLQLRFREDRLGLTAGSLTFTTTIALVPLFTVMLALFSAFPVFGRFRKVLEKQLLQGLVPDAIAKPVLLSLTQFAEKASQLGGLGLIALGASAMALMLTIDHTLNAIWRVRRKRPFTQRVLVYWAALTLGPLLLGISLWLTSYVLSASRGWVGQIPGGVAFLLNLSVFALQTTGFAALFRYVPNTFVHWPHAWAGALLTTLGLAGAQQILAFYLTKVPVHATIYGAFAAVPIFLIWLYLSWVIVLSGAVLTAYLPSLLSRVSRWDDGPGSRFALALAVVQALGAQREQAGRGLTADGLAERLRTDPLQIEPILAMLQDLDWVGHLDEADAGHGGRFVLLCDPAHTPVAPLAGATLIRPDGHTQAFWARAGLDDMTLAQAMA
ncbi:YihY family inner membrane protein [Aquabacterium fontiphilum]|uniref:YihY family inner membrane protein n=1 Tax=Aquabacterium fontiphilum TaxID=450365 RepID=UPI001EFFE7C5|nr:YihY family inner membrane protein [Aquabacterium fontiphilum]